MRRDQRPTWGLCNCKENPEFLYGYYHANRPDASRRRVTTSRVRASAPTARSAKENTQSGLIARTRTSALCAASPRSLVHLRRVSAITRIVLDACFARLLGCLTCPAESTRASPPTMAAFTCSVMALATSTPTILVGGRPRHCRRCSTSARTTPCSRRRTPGARTT